MARPGYSRGYWRLMSNGEPDSADLAAERVRLREIGEQAHRETLAKFGGITADNVVEVITWQEARIRELRGATT